jgi:hypothetical protein
MSCFFCGYNLIFYPAKLMIPIFTRNIADPTITSVQFAVTVVTITIGIFVKVYFMFKDNGFAAG